MTPKQFRRRQTASAPTWGSAWRTRMTRSWRSSMRCCARELEEAGGVSRPVSAQDRGSSNTWPASSEATRSTRNLSPTRPAWRRATTISTTSYTNHPKEEAAYPYLLLHQVEIGYQTDQISTKIELIDLPGLGARLFSDDLLTETFLPHSTGRCVFQSSEQVAAKDLRAAREIERAVPPHGRAGLDGLHAVRWTHARATIVRIPTR